MERMNAWEKYPEGKKRNEVFDFAEEYRKFLSDCKTERECVTYFAQKAEKAGFVNLDTVLEKGTKLAAGDKVYANNMGKGLALFVIGEKSMEHGMNILGAHIDSPRMDLKQDPLYEDTDFAMLDTHYYGGIKKYQWVTLPLALHGVIAKKDGTVVKVSVGDKPGDPVFGVSDLLIHLSGEQMEKKAAKVIEGENLDLIIGSIPAEADEKDDVKEKVKANMMKILAVGYIAMAITQSLSGVMRGAGDTMTPMWISMVVTVVIRVPLAYGLAFLTRTPELPNGRYQVLWISMLVSWCMGALLTLIFYKKGNWKKKALTGSSSEK